jgi:2-polyprenyl-3-methyl-5-hydroxy-6-metoxy-1,4-benzoquinol methylase
MRGHSPPEARVWAVRAEELGQQPGCFDVIVCLWNVLGHIFPLAARVEVLRQFRRRVAVTGAIFIDVNHRYNTRHYGVLPTAARWLRDRLRPNLENGDVLVRWAVDGGYCATSGHVFTHREFCRLCEAADLKIERRHVVDYATGRIRRWSFEGNLLYLLRPAGSLRESLRPASGRPPESRRR